MRYNHKNLKETHKRQISYKLQFQLNFVEIRTVSFKISISRLQTINHSEEILSLRSVLLTTGKYPVANVI